MYDSLKVDFDSKHRLVICRPYGIIDDYFAIQLLNFLLALEEVSEPFNRLLDLTFVTAIPLSSRKIQEYAEGRRQATAHLAPFHTAIIAPRPEAQAAARLYATLVTGSKIQADVFPDVSSAAQWLNLPEEALRPPTLPPPSPEPVNTLSQRPEAS
jgi:hypothetical protein